MDNEGKMEELIERMARLESDSERNEVIMKNQEEEIKNLKSMVSELAKDRNDTNIAISKILLMLEAQQKDIEEIKSCIKDITSKPERNWNTLVGSVLTALGGGLVGYLLMKLNLK